MRGETQRRSLKISERVAIGLAVEAELKALAELQENNARKELTGAERKAFAAEVGRLILKLRENSNSDSIPIWNDTWLLELAEKSGMGKSSAYNWWAAFTKAAGLSITPKQATDENRQAFFAWLGEQKAKEEAAKATKAAEQEAERKMNACWLSFRRITPARN